MSKVILEAELKTGNAIKGFRQIQGEIDKTKKKATAATSQLGRIGNTRGGAIPVKGGIQNGVIGGIQNAAMSRFSGMGAGLMSRFGSFGGGAFSGIASRATPYAGAIMAALSPAIIANKVFNKNAQQGQAYYNADLGLEKRLSVINKNQGGNGFVKGLTEDLHQLAIKGKMPLEQLTNTAARMMLAFKGNQDEVKKWTSIIADMSAATGQSADFFSELIMKAQQFGTVENENLKQLNEKGIPIYKALADNLGISVEAAKKLAEKGEVTAKQFKEAAEAAHKLSAAGANEGTVIKNGEYWKKLNTEAEAARNAKTYTAEADRLETEHQRRLYEQDEALRNAPGTQHAQEKNAHWFGGITNFLNKGIELANGVANKMTEGYYGVVNYADHVANKGQNYKALGAMRSLQNSTNGIYFSAKANGISVQELASSMEISDLSSRKAQLEAQLKDAKIRLADPYVSEKMKKEGQEAIERAEKYIKLLDETIKKKQADADAEVLRQAQAKKALELQTQALTSDPKKAYDVLEAWNLNNPNNIINTVADARKLFDEANSRIRGGTGTEADAKFIQFMKPMLDARTAETERLKKLEEGREHYLLNDKAKNGDKLAQFQLEFGKIVEEMKKLEFGDGEIASFLNKATQTAVQDREQKLKGLEIQSASLDEKIRQFEKALRTEDCTWNSEFNKTSFERGAWGQGLRMVTADTAAYSAAQQIKTMEDTNTKLQEQINLFKCEIKVIKELNLTARTS